MREIGRRGIIKGMAAAGAAALAPFPLFGQTKATADLKPMTSGVVPISPQEHLARVHRAQELMRRHGLGALLIEPGSSMTYFCGVHWWRSERLTALVIPSDGDAAVVTPYFEEPSVRESLRIPAEVRTWNEHDNPLATVAGLLRDRKATGPVGIEETVRFFAVDGLRQALPGVEIRAGAPVVRGCRMIKSAHELQLMQTAADITIAAYRYAYPRIQRGMRRAEVVALVHDASLALGADDADELVLLGEASAYPHGSGKPQIVEEGGVVLLDCGCSVQGYTSDISRSYVLGSPGAEQRKVWNEVHRGQEIAMETARVGRPAGSVDDAVRGFYESLGYGPGYKLPGLSHRTGHGIGMDGHEPVNLVHGEATPLAAGMCFSNEPGIYLPGKFGIRLEDCFHMTEAGPVWFSKPPPSIDDPFG